MGSYKRSSLRIIKRRRGVYFDYENGNKESYLFWLLVECGSKLYSSCLVW